MLRSGALRSLRERVQEWSAATTESVRRLGRSSGVGGPVQRSAIADDLDLPAAMALVSELTRSAIAPGEKAALC